MAGIKSLELQIQALAPASTAKATGAPKTSNSRAIRDKLQLPFQTLDKVLEVFGNKEKMDSFRMYMRGAVLTEKPSLFVDSFLKESLSGCVQEMIFFKHTK